MVAAIAVCRRGDRALVTFMASLSGLGLVVAVAALMASALLIVHEVRHSFRGRRRRLLALVVLNLWSVALAFGGAEAVVRVFAVDTSDGPAFAGTLLPPKSWERVAARYRAIWQKASTQGSYLVYDPERMGGRTESPKRRLQRRVRPPVSVRPRPNPLPDAERRSTDSDDFIYLSSVEGLRSPRAGMSLAAVPAKRRVALVGDSFTFGLEVPYDQTWGHQLEVLLGPGTQVLNFGVDGYGVDQALMRYRRDVEPWHPLVVVLS